MELERGEMPGVLVWGFGVSKGARDSLQMD